MLRSCITDALWCTACRRLRSGGWHCLCCTLCATTSRANSQAATSVQDWWPLLSGQATRLHALAPWHACLWKRSPGRADTTSMGEKTSKGGSTAVPTTSAPLKGVGLRNMCSSQTMAQDKSSHTKALTPMQLVFCSPASRAHRRCAGRQLRHVAASVLHLPRMPGCPMALPQKPMPPPRVRL